MAFFCLIVLFLSLLTLFLFSPVVIRYAKGTEGAISFHFVFFSFSLSKKAARDEKGRKKKPTRKKKEEKNASVPRAFLRALEHTAINGRICIQSLPFPASLSPDRAALITGGYYFLISVLAIPFGQLTCDPLLNARTNLSAKIDLRLQMRAYAFLHTFLVFLAQYRKEKEAMKHGRNKNE